MDRRSDTMKSRWEKEYDEDFDPTECDIVVTMEATIKVRVKGHVNSEYSDIEDDVDEIMQKMYDVDGVDNIKIHKTEIEKDMD